MTTKPEEGKPNVPDVFHRRKLEILAAEASTQPLPAPTEPSVDMRERFEDWIERELPGTDLYIRSDGHYGDLLTAYLWKGWQAGAASQREGRSSFDFPEKDGKYLVLADGEYTIAHFTRQTEHVGHWTPSWGLTLWWPLPAEPPKEAKQ